MADIRNVHGEEQFCYMGVKAQGNTSLACYPWLLSYRDGELPTRWQYERDAILAADQRLSEARAGMLARAKVFVLVLDECAAFERSVLARRHPGQSVVLSEEEAALYTWLVEQWNLRDHLVDVAQVSSYLPDEDLYRAHSGQERWWESVCGSTSESGEPGASFL